jgi:hypothetical protein
MSEAAKTRRADRKTARETKKADIQGGASRKEAKDAKHALKSTDRAQWKADGKSIGQSISSDSDDVGTAVSDAVTDVAKDVAENPEDLV